MSSCLQSSNVTTNKSSCKQLFDTHDHSQSLIIIESNPESISQEKVDSISIQKDLDKLNSKSEFLMEMKLPKKVRMSDNMPEIISDSYSKTNKINCYTPNWSQKEIPHDKTDIIPSISSVSRNNLENESYTNVYESFEPWSIHRTPAKLRGMYVWSPFFKSK